MNDALLEVTHGRANAGIDPSLHIWGWEIPVYLFLGGLAAGTLILSALLEMRGGRPASRALRWAPWLSAVLLSLGMGALFLDLAYKVHVFRFYLAFEPTSPMSWGSWILLLVYPVAILQGLGGLDEAERAWLREWRVLRVLRLDGPLEGLLARADAWRGTVLGASVGVGAALGIYTGILLGAMAARPAWNSAVMGPLFLASGLSTGAALLLLLGLQEGERHRLARWDRLAIGLELLLLAVLLLGFRTGGEPAQFAFWQLTGGPVASAFWALVVVAGLLVPLALSVLEARRHLPFVVLGPALVLAGGLSLRWVLLVAGQAGGFRSF